MRLLVTGGCGFIGSNFVRLLREVRRDWSLVNLDALTYAGNPENLADLESPVPGSPAPAIATPGSAAAGAVEPAGGYRFVHGSITDRDLVTKLISECDAVVHFAAESHVDRSIMDGRPFVETNVLGTQTILDALRAAKVAGRDVRLVHVSTDEVYGSLPMEPAHLKFTEQTPLSPNSPYAASKAASDLLVAAYHHTFGLDAVITRCSNNFGPWQFPEKVIPLFVTNLMEGNPVPLYGQGANVRDWIHVADHCEAVLAVLEKGKAGEVYNIGGNNEHSNLELTRMILQIMGRGEEMIKRVQDRLGHDLRYAIDAGKIQRQLGWKPTRSAWPQALQQTVTWYVEHPDWWRRVKSGAYRDYYRKQYGA